MVSLGEFESGEQLEHAIAEFRVRERPRNGRGIFSFVADHLICLGFVMGRVVSDAVPELVVDHRAEQVRDWIFVDDSNLEAVGHLLEILKRHRALLRRDLQARMMDDRLDADDDYSEPAKRFKTVDIDLAKGIEAFVAQEELR